MTIDTFVHGTNGAPDIWLFTNSTIRKVTYVACFAAAFGQSNFSVSDHYAWFGYYHPTSLASLSTAFFAFPPFVLNAWCFKVFTCVLRL